MKRKYKSYRNLTNSFSAALELYNHCLASVLDELAPEKKCPIKSDTEVAPKWIDQEYIAERQARRKFEKEWKRLGTSDSHQKYIQQRDRCILLANSKQRLFYSNLIASSDNQSVLFKTVSELWNKKNTKSLPANNGNMTTLANDFNDFFSEKIQSIRNQLTLSSNYLSIEPESCNGNTLIPLHTFQPSSREELREIISDMTIKTAFDDPLPAPLCKSAIDILLPYLLDLVNLSLLTGDIAGLKESTVSPILKKYDLNRLSKITELL